jgi:hypothetical protein
MLTEPRQGVVIVGAHQATRPRQQLRARGGAAIRRYSSRGVPYYCGQVRYLLRYKYCNKSRTTYVGPYV